MKDDKDLLSYKINFLNRWKEEVGGDLVPAEALNNRPPPPQNPPRPESPTPTVAAAPAATPKKQSGWIKFFDDMDAVSKFFKPAPASKKRMTSTCAITPLSNIFKPCEIAPPFDVQDIPATMDALGLKYSARLLRKWFANPFNYPLDSAGKIYGIQQDGRPYPKPCIDTTSIKLDWVLSNSRSESPYQIITDEDYLFGQVSEAVIAKNLRPYSSKSYLDT